MHLSSLFLRVNFINLLMILVLMKLTRPQFLYYIYLNFIFPLPLYIRKPFTRLLLFSFSRSLVFLFFGCIVSVGFHTTFHFQMVFPRSVLA